MNQSLNTSAASLTKGNLTDIVCLLEHNQKAVTFKAEFLDPSNHSNIETIEGEVNENDVKGMALHAAR